MAVELSHARAARKLLEEALQALDACRESVLDASVPRYGEGVKASVHAIRSALAGLLTWHGAPFTREAPLPVLGRFAQQLSSMLRTPLQRARPLEALARELDGKDDVNLNQQEAARMAYYTARNLVDVVLANLPASVVPEREAVAA